WRTRDESQHAGVAWQKCQERTHARVSRRVFVHERAAAFRQRPEGLIGRNGGADLEVVPRGLRFRRLLHLDQVHRVDLAAVGAHQASVMISPWEVCNPSACTSVMKASSAASFWPRRTMPNSDACLIELVVSAPALASPMIFAFDACACSRNDEKSVAGNGWRTWPSTLPPFLTTTAAVSRSSARPKA